MGQQRHQQCCALKKEALPRAGLLLAGDHLVVKPMLGSFWSSVPMVGIVLSAAAPLPPPLESSGKGATAAERSRLLLRPPGKQPLRALGCHAAPAAAEGY